MNIPRLFSVLFLAGCAGTDPLERGPVDISQLWKAWEAREGHPDLDDRKDGVIVEHYRLEYARVPDPVTGPDSISTALCDLYSCSPRAADTCFRYRSMAHVLEGDSVINFSMPTLRDKRPILRLGAAEFAYQYLSHGIALVPSARTLVDTTGGGFRVNWPKP